MTLRERWGSLPADARCGYATAAVFGAHFASRVFVGPDLLLTMSVCLIFPVLVVVALVLAYRLAVCGLRWSKAVPLGLVSGCGMVTFGAPAAPVDLHLIGCVYRAGGPDALNDWAQGLITEQKNTNSTGQIEVEQIPPQVRTNLSGWTSVDAQGLRIERGGGFYHYGVVVYPKGAVSSAEWWQRVLGWPPEVVIYHEE